MEREAFTFYSSFYKTAQKIKLPLDRLAFYEAIAQYGLTREEPDLSNASLADIAFEGCKPNLDSGWAKSEAGSKGGRSKSNSACADRKSKNKSASNLKKAESNLLSEKSKQYNQEQEYNQEHDIDYSSEPETVSEPAPEPTADEAESLFEELWKAYPQKRGKGSISKTTKTKLLKVGREQMLRAINRYVNECEEHGRYYKNGSTFFNSGYLDYLDDAYTPLSESPKKDNALDEWMREQKVKKVESMKGQSRGTDYDAMIAQSLKPETEAERDERKRKAISQNVQQLLGMREET